MKKKHSLQASVGRRQEAKLNTGKARMEEQGRVLFDVNLEALV